MEAANAGFSISPPLYYLLDLGAGRGGRARLYYTPLSINARLSANFSWLSYFNCLCCDTRGVNSWTRDFSLLSFFFSAFVDSRDVDDITVYFALHQSQTGEVSIVVWIVMAEKILTSMNEIETTSYSNQKQKSLRLFKNYYKIRDSTRSERSVALYRWKIYR